MTVGLANCDSVATLRLHLVLSEVNTGSIGRRRHY